MNNVLAPGDPAGRPGRDKMIRNTLFAIAASLMTLGTVAATSAAVTASSGTPAQIA